MPAVNKPLVEYGDLNSEHHSEKHKRDLERQQLEAMREEPPKLVVREGPGNLYEIAWTYGDMPVPYECWGHWNHKGKASEQIRGAMARLRNEANNKAREDELTRMEEKLQAEIAAEKQRLAEEDAALVAREKAAEQPALKKQTRKKAVKTN